MLATRESRQPDFPTCSHVRSYPTEMLEPGEMIETELDRRFTQQGIDLVRPVQASAASAMPARTK